MAQVKLVPTPEQAAAIRQTLEQANAACRFVGDSVWAAKTFRQFDLHHKGYQAVREQFGLSALAAVRAMAKVADACKLDRQTKRTFRTVGSIACDDRILSWRWQDRTVSIWTVAGRLRIPWGCGEQQANLLKTQQGGTDLVFKPGVFTLFAACEIEEAEPLVVEDVLGVVNIGVDRDREIHSASEINHVRQRHRRLRAALQAKGLRSAKRKLKTLSGKERRFAKDVNHRISKPLAAKAKDTHRAIALEDLRGIRSRVTVRRSQRASLHSWAFYQLRPFVTCKVKRAGVPVFLVHLRNTRRTCPACGYVDKATDPCVSS